MYVQSLAIDEMGGSDRGMAHMLQTLEQQGLIKVYLATLDRYACLL